MRGDADDRDRPRRDGWELWRQDDHGNEFLVSTFASEDDARRALGEYVARGHKQTYAVRRAR